MQIFLFNDKFVKRTLGACVGVGDTWEISVLLAQFCCGPKTAPEHKVYYFKKGPKKDISLSYLLSICKPKLWTVSMPIVFLGNVIIQLCSLSSFPTSKQFDIYQSSE